MFVSDTAHTRIEGWNKKILTEINAVAFCREHKISIVDDVRQKYGKLTYYKGYTFILINPNLDRGMRLWVLYHELGHFILHYPETSNFSQSMKRKNDREANYLAAIAMMPRTAIEGKTIDDVVFEFGYPRAVVEIRNTIYKDEGV